MSFFLYKLENDIHYTKCKKKTQDYWILLLRFCYLNQMIIDK